MDDNVGLRLALVIVGKDSPLGTLGERLHRVLADNSGRRLEDIDYPELPPETGVPFIERLVVSPFRYSECNFRCGDRVRIFLQSFAYAAEAARTNYFGAGAHTCLGRRLSLQVWKAVTAHCPKYRFTLK